MERSKQSRQGIPLPFLLGVTACLLLNWPVLSIFGNAGGFLTIAYLFFIWLCIIFTLSWYCCKEATNTPEDLGSEEDQ